MISLAVSNVRNFMNKLLMQNVFDSFYLVEASVSSYCTFEISGRTNAAWFSSGADNSPSAPPFSYASWSTIRPHMFNIIKGEKTPLKMKIILACTADEIERILRSDPDCSGIHADQVSGMFLNISFEKKDLFLTTGTAMKTFTMDRSAEKAFDKVMSVFLARQGIESDSSTQPN